VRAALILPNHIDQDGRIDCLQFPDPVISHRAPRVRDGKGMHNRVTILLDSVCAPLQRQLRYA
jgi:hypothetical protein